ncbi:MAG: hypothetical protein ACLGHM_02590 [Actinomycetes bacterium]
MSEIAVSKGHLNVRGNDALVHLNALDTTLASVPDAPDGGIASELIGAAVAVGEGAKWAWEAWVPLDTRESIDAGLHDFGSWLNPFD